VKRRGSRALYRPSRDFSAYSVASGGSGGGDADCSRDLLEPAVVALEDRLDRRKPGVSYGVSAGDGRPFAPTKEEYSLK
jgi:hypothetical protein